MLRIKRAYEPPARGDGRRILIERLWPRGMKKEALNTDAWMKEVAPSTELRQWFGHRVNRWEAFCRKYRKELDANPAAWSAILDAERRGPVTLLYSAHDVTHNSAVVLRDYLAARSASSPQRRGNRWPLRDRRSRSQRGTSAPATSTVRALEGARLGVRRKAHHHARNSQSRFHLMTKAAERESPSLRVRRLRSCQRKT